MVITEQDSKKTVEFVIRKGEAGMENVREEEVASRG